MQTANLENCKRLYELSKWGDYYKDVAMEYFWEKDELKQKTMSINNVANFVPAYDLGYLLRKLPPIITLKSRAGGRWSAQLIRGQLVYNPQEQKDEIKKWEVERTADTPENAAALLCIKLIEQGIL